MTDLVLVEESEGVRTLTLNRPDALNALTVPAMAALADRLEEAAADPAVRAVVITGAGSAFSAGGDLAFLQELPTRPAARIREAVYGAFQRVPWAITASTSPWSRLSTARRWAPAARSRSPATSGSPQSAGASARSGSTSAACRRWAGCSSCRGSWA